MSAAPRINAFGQPIGAALETSLPRPRPPRAAMRGRYCAVVPTDASIHASELYRAFARDAGGRDWTYLGYGPFDTYDAFRRWLDTTCTGDDPLFHTILDGAGRPAGLASYLRIEPAVGVMEVGHIHLSPGLQRSRAATEAMALMMARAFDELGYRRYEWKCDVLNAPSRRAAERLGFTYEGTFRQATAYKGRNRDTAWYSVVDGEWPALRDAFDAWLSPENFDAEGRQISPLATPGRAAL